MIKYRLIGLDRFSYEYYECGDFDTEEEVKAAKQEHEEQAIQHSSDSSIADRYWIEIVQG